MQQATAWILQLGDEIHAAIGEREMIHIIDNPELTLAETPNKYCRQQISWQGTDLPVTDFREWFMNSNVSQNDVSYVAIVAFPEHNSDTPHYGGIVIEAIPYRTQVKDSQACALPESSQSWQEVSISCFSDQGQATPILNLAALFSSLAVPSVAKSNFS